MVHDELTVDLQTSFPPAVIAHEMCGPVGRGDGSGTFVAHPKSTFTAKTVPIIPEWK